MLAQIPPVKKTIGSNEYSVTPLPTTQAIRLKSRLLKLVGPTISQAMSAVDIKEGESILDANVDGSALGSAVESLFTRLDEDTVLNLVKELIRPVQVVTADAAGEKVVLDFNKDTYFDTFFSGRLDEMYKVVFFVLEVNYKSFFGGEGIGSLLGKMKDLFGDLVKK